ncbi:MAG: hypothetical protein GXX83_01190 [Gaiellales bacterium]|nr:hypothetical protein [Gaiellales bacterium]
MTVYLIDGYNLLHALVKAENRGAGPGMDLERERERLVDRLASFMGGTNDRAIAVFDSRQARLERAQTVSPNVEVYYGSLRRSADTIIERAAYRLRRDETIVVVTSDYVLQQTVFSPGVGNHPVVRQSSAQFIAELRTDATNVTRRSVGPAVERRVEDALAPGVAEHLRQLRDDLLQGRGPAGDQ